MRALIIDDATLNIEVLAMMLATQGIDYTAVSELHDWKQALESMTDLSVIFLDLEFPSGSALDILPALQSHKKAQNVPIVIHSVNTNYFEALRQLGLNGFVGKPIDQDRFPSQLARILSGIQVWEI